MSDDPFRNAAARPGALVALAGHAAPATTPIGLTCDALLVPNAMQRIAAALGVPTRKYGPHAQRIGTALGLGAIAGMISAVLFARYYTFEVAMASIAVGMIAHTLLRDSSTPQLEAEVTRRLADDVALPFPVTGYDAWLASAMPVIDVHVRGELDHALVADAARGIDPRIVVVWIDARTFRLAVPALPLNRHWSVGDRERWNRIAKAMLVPIHQDVGIARVEMGALA